MEQNHLNSEWWREGAWWRRAEGGGGRADGFGGIPTLLCNGSNNVTDVMSLLWHILLCMSSFVSRYCKSQFLSVCLLCYCLRSV